MTKGKSGAEDEAIAPCSGIDQLEYCGHPCIDWLEYSHCKCTRAGLDWDELDDDEAIMEELGPILPPYEELFPD